MLETLLQKYAKITICLYQKIINVRKIKKKKVCFIITWQSGYVTNWGIELDNTNM